jgi:very-short-patch-repair endonuclease
VHESRRFEEGDVLVRDGVRMVRPAVAAVHAAIWATSDRQARLYLVLAVQQRRATAAQLRDVVEALRRCPRRGVLRGVLTDLEGGVRSMAELDFATALRRRGLPEPDRQVIRQRPSGTEYLDCRFDAFALTVEIDGEQHDKPEQRLADVVRDLVLIADGDDVVRIPRLALALDSQRVLQALEKVFLSRGWSRAA